jgi:glutamate synthase domain-containing protein 3
MPERVMTRVNQDLVEVLRPDHDDVEELRWLVERHVSLTGSRRGQDLLDGWESAIEHLWHIVPRERVERITAGAARRVTTA